MTEVYNTMSRLFDEIFSDSTRLFRLVDNSQPQRFNKLVSSSQFPPANILCNTKTKELTIQVALAGYSEEDISLSFQSDYLKLVVDRVEKGDDSLKEGQEITEYVMQRGIKLPQHVEASWMIDPRYYSRDNVKVSFKDGLLTIVIAPRDEIKPVNIKLFGKLDDKPAIENRKDE